MDNILEFIAARESSTNGRDKRKLGHRSDQLRLAYLRERCPNWRLSRPLVDDSCAAINSKILFIAPAPVGYWDATRRLFGPIV